MLYERVDMVDDRILIELLLPSKDYGGSRRVGSLSVYTAHLCTPYLQLCRRVQRPYPSQVELLHETIPPRACVMSQSVPVDTCNAQAIVKSLVRVSNQSRCILWQNLPFLSGIPLNLRD